MHTIGLIGKAGSGKSYLATELCRRANAMGRQEVIVPLAGPLKALARMMGWNGEKDEKGRRLLQLLGTECGRQCIGDDVWIKLWRQQVARVQKEHGDSLVVVVDDVRFENEAVALHGMGGHLVHVVDPTVEVPGTAADHASEDHAWVHRVRAPVYFNNKQDLCARSFAQSLLERILPLAQVIPIQEILAPTEVAQ